MRSPEVKRRVLELAVLLVPLVLIKLAAPLFGGGAETAAASGPSARKKNGGTIELVRTEWSDAQVAAAAYLREAGAAPIERSPFKHTGAQRAAPVVVEEDTAFEVRVTMIMETSGGGVALVDGETCRLGSPVAGGAWTVVAIDAAGRTVTFEHVKSGERIARTLED